MATKNAHGCKFRASCGPWGGSSMHVISLQTFLGPPHFPEVLTSHHALAQGYPALYKLCFLYCNIKMCLIGSTFDRDLFFLNTEKRKTLLWTLFVSGTWKTPPRTDYCQESFFWKNSHSKLWEWLRCPLADTFCSCSSSSDRHNCWISPPRVKMHLTSHPETVLWWACPFCHAHPLSSL